MIPLYKQLAEKIKIDIEKVEVNTPILSERDLALKYNISRMTARKAIDELVSDGYLYRDTNKGTFVSDSKLHKQIYSNWLFSSIGDASTTNIIYFDIKKDDVKIAELLNMSYEDYFMRVVKVNHIDVPVSIDEIYINKFLAKEKRIDNREDIAHIHKFIEGFVIKQKFTPCIVPIKYAAMLHVKVNSILMRVDCEILTKNGETFAHIISYINDKYEVAVTL